MAAAWQPRISVCLMLCLMLWCGVARHGMARHGMARHGMARYSIVHSIISRHAVFRCFLVEHMSYDITMSV